MEPAPQYEHCLDAGDATQLTDGQYVSGYFWTQPGCVGWSGQRTVIITIDLGADRPISGVSFNTAAGAAGVKWPESITLLVAGDDGLFHHVGDLVALSTRKSAPPAEGYAVHKFQTDELRTHGRKLALVVNGEPFTFCDEIEVLKGDDAWLSEPLPGPGEPNVAAWTKNLLTHEGVKRRIRQDADAGARPRMQNAALRRSYRELDAALRGDWRRCRSSMGRISKPSCRSTPPMRACLTRWRKRVARERRGGLEAVGRRDMGPVELTPAMPGPAATPPRPTCASSMMLNEFRAAAFNIATADGLLES